MSLEMYQQNILDHYKHPRNFGKIDNTTNHAHVANLLCGDELDFYLTFTDQGTVLAATFTGQGCTISVAAASMLSEKLKGMERESVEKLSNDSILEMLGVPVNPARLKCATLSLESVQKAIGHH